MVVRSSPTWPRQVFLQWCRLLVPCKHACTISLYVTYRLVCSQFILFSLSIVHPVSHISTLSVLFPVCTVQVLFHLTYFYPGSHISILASLVPCLPFTFFDSSCHRFTLFTCFHITSYLSCLPLTPFHPDSHFSPCLFLLLTLPPSLSHLSTLPFNFYLGTITPCPPSFFYLSVTFPPCQTIFFTLAVCQRCVDCVSVCVGWVMRGVPVCVCACMCIPRHPAQC